MSIMLAGLKAVRQRKRMRNHHRRDHAVDDDDDIGISLDTRQYFDNHYVIDDAFSLCPEDESPMMGKAQSRKKIIDGVAGACCINNSGTSNTKSITGGNVTTTTSATSNTGSGSNPTDTRGVEYQNDDDYDADDDEVITAGNEALIFIYGHNINLYTDVFHLSRRHYIPVMANKQRNDKSHLISLPGLTVGSDNDERHDNSNSSIKKANDLTLLLERIDRSYKEQMRYLNHTNVRMAADYFHRRNNRLDNGKYSTIINTMDPKTFLDIQRDAVMRAYDILTNDESRNEYDELLTLHHQEMLAEEDVVVVVSPSESPSSIGRNKVEKERALEGDYGDDDSGVITTQTTADDVHDDDGEDDDEGKIRSKANQRRVMATPQKYSNHQQHQYSPTDPVEFDTLIHRSLSDEEYYNQLFGTNKKREMLVEDKEELLIFDPFNLQGEDKNCSFHESYHSFFPEKPIGSGEYDEDVRNDDESAKETTTSFICSLPSGEDDDGDEITMGRLIELQEKMSKTKKMNLILDDVLQSSRSDGTDNGDDGDSSIYSNEDDDGEAEDDVDEEIEEGEDDESSISRRSSTSSFSNKNNHPKSNSSRLLISQNQTESIDDNDSTFTITKNYFLSDDVSTESLRENTRKGPSASMTSVTSSSSSCASRNSNELPEEENNKKKTKMKKKGLKAKVRHFVKTISSKSGKPEQEMYESRSNNNNSSKVAGAAAHPKTLETASTSFDPDEPNLSIADNSTSSALVSLTSDYDDDDDEEVAKAEVEALLSIASTFSAMDAAAAIAERVRSRGGGLSTTRLPIDDEDDDDEEDDASIDCFDTDGRDSGRHRHRGRRLLEQFEADDDLIEDDDDYDYDEDEYSHSGSASAAPPSSPSSSRGIFGSCIDGVGSSIDNTLDSVERVCIG